MLTSVLGPRRAGALLPFSSLEAALGRGGRAFIDWLQSAGFAVWQFLPAGPTGAGGSPYWARSDAAGNRELLDPQERPPLGTPEHRAFLEASHAWLEDYACFEAISRRQGGSPWQSWPAEYRDRESRALERVKRAEAERIREVESEQFAFAWQWARLKAYAGEHGVALFGDLPFYVSPDSAETWVARDQFQLDAAGEPRALAGVPPDYFSELGQLWGNPLYDWDAMSRDGFAFWRARLRRQLARVDLLRLDHFRAFAAHWAVPAGACDARGGAWKRTPGWALLRAASFDLGRLALVAEDLGLITPDVVDLRRAFRLPGMRVLQFGFDGSRDNPHLPHMLDRDSVVYTGTHDNDTAAGWYASLTTEGRRRVDEYLRLAQGAMPEALVAAALGSVSALAVIPVQDLLGLGSSARFNTPATTHGNWTWRLPPGALTRELAERYRHLNRTYGRAA